MALFGKKKEEKEEKKAPEAKSTPVKREVSGIGIVPEKVLLRPHLSEKALLQGVKNVYVFEIAPRATKRDVARAVSVAYNVTPTAVRVARVPGKWASARLSGRPGKTSETKKAYVTLKEGDRLQLM